MRRTIFITLLIFLVCGHTSAQNKRLFLFERFSNAKVKLRPRGIATYLMNYDASGGKMFFMQGKDMMELISTANIDTISWGTRKFIPGTKRFLEVIDAANGRIYVDWVIKDIVIGRKGAYGQRTEGSVQNLRLFDFGAEGGVSAYTPYDEQNTFSNDILKRKNENAYYIDMEGKREKITSVKSLEKLFPKHKETIRKYSKEHRNAFDDIISALEIINFCMGL